MKTRSYLQRRTQPESESPLAMTIKPRPWSTAPQPPQAIQRQPGQDGLIDLFSHDPGPRSTPNLLQTKLTVGAPNDVYEQEADRVAEQVMSMPDTKPAVQREGMPEEEEDPQAKALGGSIQREAMPEEEEEIQAKPLSATITPLVQREVMPEEEEEIQAKALGGAIQREAMPEEEEEPIQARLIQREAVPEEEEEIQMKRSSGGGFEAGGDFESRLSSSKGGGSPLPDDVRGFMEPRFGADFGGVRVHTGGEAVQMNRAVNAQAFAHGQDVYFGAGKGPGKDALTAHELTHVVQQGKSVNTNVQTYRLDESIPEDIERPTLRRGSSGSFVLELQEKLNARGANSGLQVDSFFGALTHKAVKDFQSNNLDEIGKPLVSDGVVGKRTWHTLDLPIQASIPKPSMPRDPETTTDKAPEHHETDSPSPGDQTLPNVENIDVTKWPQVLPRATRKAKSNNNPTDTNISAQNAKESKIPDPESIQHPTLEISAEDKAAIVASIMKYRESIPDVPDDKLIDHGGKGWQYNANGIKGKSPSKIDEENAKPKSEMDEKRSKNQVEINHIIWDELGGEGGFSAVNTYDSQIVTWGKGFGGAKGGLPDVVTSFFKKDNVAHQAFLKAGIHLEGKNWLVVNPTTGLIEQGNNALRMIQFDKKLISFLISIAENNFAESEGRQQNFIDAQYEYVRNHAGKVPPYIVDGYPKPWNSEVIAFAGHSVHAYPGTKGWKLYEWTAGEPIEIFRAYGMERRSVLNKESPKLREKLINMGASVVSYEITQSQFITFSNRLAERKLRTAKTLTELIPEEIAKDQNMSHSRLQGHVFFEEAKGSDNFYHIPPA